MLGHITGSGWVNLCTTLLTVHMVICGIPRQALPGPPGLRVIFWAIYHRDPVATDPLKVARVLCAANCGMSVVLPPVIRVEATGPVVLHKVEVGKKILPYDDGIAVTPKSPKLLLGAMEAIYHDPEKRLIINLNGWGKGWSMFTWMELIGVAPWPVAGVAG